MRYQEIITELRRNPSQNPKIDAVKALVDRHNNTDDKIAGTTNLFVSMTAIDKLGINPKSGYETPIGIYAYPSDYVLKRIGGEQGTFNRLPYVGEHPYVNLFNASGNIVNLSTMTHEEANDYIAKVEQVFKQVAETPEDAEREIQSILKNKFMRIWSKGTEGGKLWTVVQMLANYSYRTAIGSSKSVAMNKLFRSIGIDGVIDNGTGIIHENEPTQAVFFTTRVIDDVERIENKYSEFQRTADANARDKFNNMSDEELVQQITSMVRYSSPSEVRPLLRNLPRPIRVRMLVAMPHFISAIDPSDHEIALAYKSGAKYEDLQKYMSDKVLHYVIKQGNMDDIKQIAQRPKLSPHLQELLFSVDSELAKLFVSPTPSIVRKLGAKKGSTEF